MQSKPNRWDSTDVPLPNGRSWLHVRPISWPADWPERNLSAGHQKLLLLDLRKNCLCSLTLVMLRLTTSGRDSMDLASEITLFSWMLWSAHRLGTNHWNTVRVPEAWLGVWSVLWLGRLIRKPSSTFSGAFSPDHRSHPFLGTNLRKVRSNDYYKKHVGTNAQHLQSSGQGNRKMMSFLCFLAVCLRQLWFGWHLHFSILHGCLSCFKYSFNPHTRQAMIAGFDSAVYRFDTYS